MTKAIKFIELVIYWSIVAIPFSIAIAPAPMNIFMGFLISGFLLKKILKKEEFFVKTSINIPLLFLFIITCLSIFNSINYKDSIKGGILRLLQYIFIIFSVTAELKDKEQIKKIIISMCLGIILVSVDEIFQIITGRDFIRGYAPVIILDLVRATASFKDPNTLGIYLSAILPLMLGLALYYFKSIKKIIFILISLIGLTGVLLSYSRPTLLAVYVSMLFLGIFKRNKVIVVFLIIAILISPFIAPKAVRDWAKEVNYNPLRFMCNDDRIAIYRHTLNMIRAHPVIGLGTNTYMKNYRRYKEFPEYRNVVTSDYLYAHNNFLHMAGETGLLGLFAF